jgi:hypothetical protein
MELFILGTATAPPAPVLSPLVRMLLFPFFSPWCLHDGGA